MWCSDAQAHTIIKTIGNINAINIHAITEIQKEIDPCDMISLVFLLYDVPDTALQRLVIYERVYKDSIGESASDLLHQWARHAQNRPSWKYEFLEALVTCQLNKIVRKLGFNVADTKKSFETGNSYISPMKKLLYRLCENIELENLSKLKNTLLTYKYDMTDYENCELIFLDLMCKKFISIQQYNYGDKVTSNEYKVGELADIIENFSGLENFAKDLRALESGNKDHHTESVNPIPSSSNIKQAIDLKDSKETDHVDEDYFNESFDLISKLINDVKIDSLKSDKETQNSDVYDIKDPNKVGICYIINQEIFYPSKSTIKSKFPRKQLQTRTGSTKDKIHLEKTMSALNFEVISDDNLDHMTMMKNIKDILMYRVRRDHSIFMLCIMSHGTRGHVYAADSVKVKVEAIENLLDCDGAKHLQGMPKVMILQACQINDEDILEIVADAPNYYIKKSDILVYSATAPGYEAYRLEKYGSLFIQILCRVIEENANNTHLEEIFTKVTKYVHNICTQLQRDQLPKKETTLLKNLHLKKYF